MGKTVISKAVILLLVGLFLNSINIFADDMKEKGSGISPSEVKSIVLQGYGYSGNIAAGIDIPSDSGLFHFVTLVGIARQTNSMKRHGLLTLKGLWHPFDRIPITLSPERPVSWEPLYTGLSVIMHECIFSDCDDDTVFYELPDRYPDSYYPPTAIVAALNMGSSIIFEKTAVYAEMVITMQGLDAYYHNRDFFNDNYDYWGLEAVASLGIGIKIFY